MGKIDDLLADPKFMQFAKQNPDRARTLVSEMRQKDFGKIPKTVKIFTKVKRQSVLATVCLF